MADRHPNDPILRDHVLAKLEALESDENPDQLTPILATEVKQPVGEPKFAPEAGNR